MERQPVTADLTDREWRLIDNCFMPAARVNADNGTYGAYGSLSGDQWMFWHSSDAENDKDGLVAICNGQDGSVTSYAIDPSNRTVQRVHISADTPALKWTASGEVTDVRTALSETDEDDTLSGILGNLAFQLDVGLDTPVGEELRPFQDVMEEVTALHGVDPDQIIAQDTAQAYSHVTGSVFAIIAQ